MKILELPAGSPALSDSAPLATSAGTTFRSTLQQIYDLFTPFLKTYFDTLYAKYLGDADFYKYSIVTSVASGNLTVALKNYEGNDPTPSKPVKIQIGGVVRTITSALSVTINAGTNWFNAGSSELATKEIDYFPYLRFFGGYQTVGLFFSRYPSANLVSDFSASGTYTNEKYGSDSDGVNALVTDSVVNIGRFNATLSAGGAYTWSLGTGPIINSPCFDSRTVDYNPSIVSSSGTLTTASATGKYTIKGNQVFCKINGTVTTNGTGSSSIIISLPFAPKDGLEAFTGRENGVTGKTLNSLVSGNTVYIRYYDGTYPGANGAVFPISGIFEI